jgi:hypothetical protein
LAVALVVMPQCLAARHVRGAELGVAFHRGEMLLGVDDG